MQGNRINQGQGNANTRIGPSGQQQKQSAQPSSKPNKLNESKVTETKDSSSNTKKTEGGFLQGCLGCLGVILLILVIAILIFALKGKNEPEQNTNTAIAPAPAVNTAKPLGVDGQVRSAITTAIGAKNNTGLARIIDLQVNDHAGTKKDGDKIVIAKLQANDNLSNNMIKGGMQLESIKVFKELFKIADVEEVAIAWEFPMTDKYGQTSSSIVMKINLNRATATKINWDSFDKKNFESVANTYWEHPSIRSN